LLNVENADLSVKKAIHLNYNRFNRNEQDNKFLFKIARTNATVLLLGESGTGKSNLAKEIHKQSFFCNGPFVEVQCTTIPEGLLESELFGHEKGSFTGAYKTQIGKAEQAIGGTLFLDEIGELNLANQSKLLKLMQDKVISRIGSNHDIKIPTRIIIATNKNLWEMVQSGSLRRDLYYRMNIFEVTLQNLSQRTKEILFFVEEFITEFNLRESSTLSSSIKPELKIILMNYPWPGNIRELKNVIDRLCYLSEDGELRPDDLPECFYKTKTESSETICKSTLFPKEKKTLKQIEKEHIELILNTEDSFDKAAQTLGITTVTLWRKRKEFNLVEPRDIVI
jgi:transcriptional regulator with PAS, ATPase and Fis domain